jgi:very-short-patch-repair endonuclease
LSIILPYNNNLLNYSRELRANMTDSERRLWAKLRLKQINNLQFYRQKIIGDYIVDFFCPRAQLVIEVDGGQHYFGQAVENDKKRDYYLRSLGLNVLRFSDTDVLKNLQGVIEIITENTEVLEMKIPLNPPFSKGEMGPSPFKGKGTKR